MPSILRTAGESKPISIGPSQIIPELSGLHGTTSALWLNKHKDNERKGNSSVAVKNLDSVSIDENAIDMATLNVRTNCTNIISNLIRPN